MFARQNRALKLGVIFESRMPLILNVYFVRISYPYVYILIRKELDVHAVQIQVLDFNDNL